MGEGGAEAGRARRRLPAPLSMRVMILQSCMHRVRVFRAVAVTALCRALAHACTHSRAHTRMRAHAHTHMHAHAHMHPHMRTHTPTHARTHAARASTPSKPTPKPHTLHSTLVHSSHFIMSTKISWLVPTAGVKRVSCLSIVKSTLSHSSTWSSCQCIPPESVRSLGVVPAQAIS